MSGSRLAEKSAPGPTRTGNHRIRRPVLYPLSYRGDVDKPNGADAWLLPAAQVKIGACPASP